MVISDENVHDYSSDNSKNTNTLPRYLNTNANYFIQDKNNLNKNASKYYIWIPHMNTPFLSLTSATTILPQNWTNQEFSFLKNLNVISETCWRWCVGVAGDVKCGLIAMKN